MILAIIDRHCPHCGCFIANVEREDVIECGICDFVQAAMTLSDSILTKAIRLGQSADRVELVLNHF
jgi:ribosomal protein S27AE